jgi:hypothetical protein
VACGSIVEPGMLLTDLLVAGDSALWAEVSIDDHAKQTADRAGRA